jgi:hypothetical protein
MVSDRDVNVLGGESIMTSNFQISNRLARGLECSSAEIRATGHKALMSPWADLENVRKLSN